VKITKYYYFKSVFNFIFLYVALTIYFVFKDEPLVALITMCFLAAIALGFYNKGLQNMKKNKGMEAEVSTTLIVFTIVECLVFLIILYVTYIE
jgi:hypothetical protein